MPKTQLSIIIVNWNTQALLKQCLESITGEYHRYHKYHKYHKRENVLSLEIIVVDNGSTDGSVEYLKSTTSITSKDPNIKFSLIENKENLGFGRANNQGIKVAKGEYIMLLNSDTIVKPGAVELLVDYLDTHPETSVVGPKLLNVDSTPQANCGRFPDLIIVFIMLALERFILKKLVRFSPTKGQAVDWLMGAAFVVRREVFEKVGGLDEGIFMYMEEVEWFYRAHKQKYRVECFPKAEIIHLGRGSSKSGKKDPILNIYRGLIHFYRKHYGKLALLLLQIMLQIKARSSYMIGIVTKDDYLKETYAQALKIY